MRKPLSIFLASAFLALISSCGPGSNIQLDSNGDPFNAGGSFFAQGSNILDGMSWQINRPIRIEFNHAVDPDSINFGTIQLRSTDAAGSGNPVTGTFEIEAGSLGRAIVFRPTCPTNETNTNGAFIPGSVSYELVLPTRADSPTVLRDIDGRSLSSGLRRSFTTPPETQPAFLDLVQGPAVVSSVVFPKGLNFFANPDPVVSIRFNQAIDGRSANLNTKNLTLLYSDGEIGSGNENTFTSTNKVPGNVVLIENCTVAGALVEFRITGLLPVNRNLRLLMSNQFGDIIGQVNTSQLVVATHTTPTLASIYKDPTWVETDETVDEFRDDFDTSKNLALAEPIPFPLAQVGDGFIAASFDYPGNFVAADNNFFLATGVSSEIFTDSQSTITDSNNRQHTVQNGVMNVHDFTIQAGAVLRGRGANPLVIYATGAVDISGTLNASGNNATWPTSLNSPQFVEGGAGGECGGGRGGDASQIGNAETLRAMNGDGPFFITGGGGGGGEGGFNGNASTGGVLGLNNTVVAGGGGGGFAVTENVAVLWDQWPITTGWVPSGTDNAGPDHDIDPLSTEHIHSQMVASIGITPENPNGNGIFGSEDGIRGVNSATVSATVTSGPLGMEDALPEVVIDGFNAGTNHPLYDPAWNTGTVPPFQFGNPTAGPDPGLGGPSVFSNDLTGFNTRNDFWGTRLSLDGSVVSGELLTPWAGAGGGGSGDSMLIRVVAGATLLGSYPVVPFQKSATGNAQGWESYRKGAGGGGGGGQVLIMAIGMIHIGAGAKIQVNGGIGFSGESLIYSDNGISGSGGGAGGHLVLHSSTGLDLSAIDIGTASNAAQLGNLTAVDNIQAFGGRRGWAGPSYSRHSGSQGTKKDGNDTFAVGRGGAGANGVIQIHVPNPLTDILWHPNSRDGILDFINSSTGAGEEPTDFVEEMLNFYTAPKAYSLIPFFSSRSMVVSEWIDTGLAELRLGQPASYPKYGDSLLAFSGINPNNGLVGKLGDSVLPLSDVATGGTGVVTFDGFTLTIPNAATFFDAKFLRLPTLLIGYDILPSNIANSSTFEIVSATYNSGTDVMVLTSAVSDGPLLFALDGGNPTWSVREKFFRVDTVGAKNSLPASTSITFEFQGADEATGLGLEIGNGIPGDPIDVGGKVWHTDLTLLDGARFIRYRVTFQADAQGNGIDLSSPLPVIDYVKIPMLW
ncbi:MAG: hypothetical protein QM477_08750 [Planctomycetota bacterium]